MKRSKSENDNGELEAENVDQKVKEPYLSGAYIRSFVKQLASSRTKDSPNMRERENLEREGMISREQDLSRKPHPPPPPQQHKKQVRRRLHTRKPYQEKLLNMAEARREIVSALKLHRAAMKQATDRKQESEELKSRRKSYTTSDKLPFNYPDINYVYNSPDFISPYYWSVPSISPPPIFQENLDFVLPSQTLGLNLNLQDFITTPSSVYSASSPSTSSSPPPSAATEEIPVMGATTPEVVGFGDQKQIERCKFIKSMEIRAEDRKDEEFVSSPFDEVMEFPAWLNANESCLQHVNDFCYFQDPALPCMDIEEIEGMDGDWLA